MGKPLEKGPQPLGIAGKKDDRFRSRLSPDREEPGGDRLKGLVPGDGFIGPGAPLPCPDQWGAYTLPIVDPLPACGTLDTEDALADRVIVRPFHLEDASVLHVGIDGALRGAHGTKGLPDLYAGLSLRRMSPSFSTPDTLFMGNLLEVPRSLPSVFILSELPFLFS